MKSVAFLCLFGFAFCLSAAQATNNGIPEMTPFVQDNSTDTTDPNVHMLSESFSFHEKLDARYDMYWNFNDSRITFELVVKTNGWVGFGLSPNGKMKHSDMIIGWIKDGETYFGDRHAEGNWMPPLDESQDWHLISARETGEFTILKIDRKLDTCDDDDLPILDGTTRIMFAYNFMDPDDATDIPYHGSSNRGSKSVLLLVPPEKEDVDTNTLPPDTHTLDFTVENYALPSATTTYRCKYFELPPIDDKHHMIKYGPVIQEGHESIVHHMILYSCPFGLSRPVGTEFTCWDDVDERYEHDCPHIVLGWAVGGTEFNLPSHVGHPFGTDRDPVYFMLEIHYNNPDQRSESPL